MKQPAVSHGAPCLASFLYLSLQRTFQTVYHLFFTRILKFTKGFVLTTYHTNEACQKMMKLTCFVTRINLFIKKQGAAPRLMNYGFAT